MQIPTVIVVHRNPIVRHFLEVMLAIHGYSCVACETPQDFADGLLPSSTGCVLVDPFSSDGDLEAVRRSIAYAGARLRIIAFTSPDRGMALLEQSGRLAAASPQLQLSTGDLMASVSAAMSWAWARRCRIPV